MRATRFAARASGPVERVAGFVAHLRLNGMRLGVGETAGAVRALAAVDPADPAEARLALRSVLAGDREGWERFDDLFDAFWYDAGRRREGAAPPPRQARTPPRPALWHRHLDGDASDDAGEPDGPAGEGGAAEGADGRLLATRTESVARRDLRGILDEETLREAERAALLLARALRDRRSRRRRRALRGPELDIRRILRASLARGGEPVDLYRRARPERPMRIVAFCDVSGSMTVHARVFLAFLKGLIGADATADAYLFHTRLVRIAPALRDRDTLRAAARLSLMAEGFGGGTDIAGCLTTFCEGHAARALRGRTVVLILSDGYCTSEPRALGAALARLRRRARRVVWLSPLAGRPGGEAAARHMAAARPHLDALLPADSVASLAALEAEFARL